MAVNDLLSAALRHQRDSERLATGSPGLPRSLDQARHLAGFGPECARKALLDPRQAMDKPLRRAINQAIGHGFSATAEGMVTWALAFNPEARDLPAAGWAARYPALCGWNPECRYERSGTAQGEAAALHALLAVARAAVDAATEALWLHGVGSGDQ